MDIDVFVARHEKTWNRLENLVDKHKLSGRQCDELISLYQVSSSHLSYVQSNSNDLEIVLYLSKILTKANSKINVSPRNNFNSILDFFKYYLPLSLYEYRRWIIACMIFFLVVSVTEAIWLINTPNASEFLADKALLQKYADEDFVSYYTNYGATDFTAQVWTNNAFIAVKGIALGITGIGPLYLLYQNAVSVGVVGSVMYMHGDLSVFFKFILPHGLLELTAIFIACGCGMKMFWTLIVPDDNSRSVSIAKQGRYVLVIALGIILILFFAGLIEGFITGSNLSSFTKIFIGVVSFVSLWIYILFIGKKVSKQYSDVQL